MLQQFTRRTCFIAFIPSVLVGAFAHASGTPPTTSPAALRELVLAHRAPLLEGLQVSFRVRSSQTPTGDLGSAQTLAWNREGVIFLWGSPPATTFHYSRASGVATRLDGDEAIESSDPNAVQFGEVATEMECAMGIFPTRDVGGRRPFTNDLAQLLTRGSAVILPETSEAGGIECVVVELPDENGDVFLRGYYAPVLGYAQVRLDFLGRAGCVMATWEASSFYSAIPGATAIPLHGEFRQLDCSEQARSWIQVEVAQRADENPEVLVGPAVSTALSLPAGTWIENLDSGVRAQVARNGDAVAEAMLATPIKALGESTFRLGSLWWTAPALACVTLMLGTPLRRHFTRRAVGAS